jgi:hypothetical protein
VEGHTAAAALAGFLTAGGGFGERSGGQRRGMDGQLLSPTLIETRRVMTEEARSFVDAGRERGVVLRLIGGLAVHEHCAGLAACMRDHADVDLVGLRRQTGPMIGVFGRLGFRERVHVRQATSLAQAQFVRECVHVDAGGAPAHRDDHVDVFFDSFKLDHTIDLRSRLELHPYAIPLTDVLATKLQMHAPEPRDVRDALMLLAASHGPGTGPEEVDADYLARLCANDWGLFYDVSLTVQRCAEALDRVGLSPAERGRAADLLVRLTGAVDAAPKTLAWRLRARVGTRRAWYQIVEEQDGAS